jgi:hypothetical protein
MGLLVTIVGHVPLLKVLVLIALPETSLTLQFYPDTTSITPRWVLAVQTIEFARLLFVVRTKQRVLELVISNVCKPMNNVTTMLVLDAQFAVPNSTHQIMNAFLAQTKISCLFISRLLL